MPTPLPARTVAPVATPKPAPVTPTPQAGPVTTIDPGTWGVGDGIEAGTYRTTGSDSSDVPYCYWERLRNTSGELDAIIANDVVQGPAIVTIAPTDVAFKTSGCA